jgi:hypothetical protein
MMALILMAGLITISQLFCGDLYDDFENETYTLDDGQKSPNKKWISIYNGGGSSGVRNDFNDTNNNIFFMHPKIAKSANETYASLVTTTRNFSNFQMSVDVKTEKQLRANSFPNTWETAWIFFRYTDDFHYYWFVQKPTGIELGKKDCNTCANPFEGQEFLYTDKIPTLKIGEWSNWKISAIENNITISLDGTEFKLTDFDMSPELGHGSIGFYTEDAGVAFDNFTVKEITLQE